MDFRSVKNLMIGGKAVSNLLVGGRLVWKKAEPEPGQAYDYEVEYVETDGVASYMDLGIVPDISTSYEIDLMYNGGKYSGTTTLRNCAYGCATGTITTTASHVLYFRETDGFIKFAKPTSNLFTELVPGVRFKVSVSAAVDGKSSISVGDHAETGTNTYTAATTMKFGCSYTESPDFYATARFYSAKFWQDGVLVRDLVPVVKDGEAGLYDKVGNVFYGNASGSGAIAAGPKVETGSTYIETDGVASYMDLGFVPSSGTTYSVDFCWESGYVMGANTRTPNRITSFAIGSSSLDYLGIHRPSADALVVAGRHEVSYDGNSILVDGDSYQLSGSATNAERTLVIGQNGLGTYYGKVKLYSAKFWESGVLIRDLVPYSGPRGVGLLDKVHDVLYTNAGGGALTYGVEGGAWTNPYITDGLLGMWDAEWNEAGGVHNPDLMQLNDLTGNLFPMPVAVLGDNWASRSENPIFKASDYPMLNELIGSDSRKRYAFEGYSSFDPSILSSYARYAFNSALSCKTESGTNATDQMGYGLNSSGYCVNMRGFLATIASTVPGEDGVGRTFSCSSYKMSGDKSVAYLDGEKYGEYLWTSSTAYTDVVSFTFGVTGNYWDKIRTSCVRIYNRVLTPEEVAHNARVDRERFGGGE